MDDHELETRDSLISSKTYSVLSNHPLAIFVMRETPLIIISKMDVGTWINDQTAADETMDEYLRNPKHFKGLCQFLAAESRQFYNLGVKIDKLQHTIFMINFFPHSVLKNTLPFTKAEYIENVMELYVVNTLGIYDRILELVNLLYDLKISKKTLNKKRAITDKLDNIPLLKELHMLDQIFSEVRKSRNTVVHEASYYNENLENIFQAEIRFREAREKAGMDDAGVKKRAKEIEAHYNTFVTDKMTDLYMNDSILTKTLKNIFDELYKQHLKILKSYGYRPKVVNGMTGGKDRKDDSIRKRSSFYALDIDDIMRAVDKSSVLKREDADNHL